MLEDGADLLLIHAGEPLDELVDRGATGQILIEREQWNPCAGKHPGAANSPWYAFDGSAGLPVSHLRHVVFANTIFVVRPIVLRTDVLRS